MKTVTVKEISQELLNLSPKELRDLCLRLARFRKENKELLTYLLFESSDESLYVESVKKEIDLEFEQVNKKSYYCSKLKKFTPSINRNAALRNLYLRQVATIREKLGSLHEDLQYDYGLELEALD